MDILWTIAIVMTVSGLLGGLINFYIADSAGDNPLAWWKHIIVGIGAAFMVPLFLNMISSGLIDSIRGTSQGTQDPSKLFILAGFCLVAAVSSRSFINTISERVLQEARDAKKKAEYAQEQAAEARAIVAPYVEGESQDESSVRTQLVNDKTEMVISNDEKIILSAMTTGPYTMRTIAGIAKDTGLDRAQVNEYINLLMAKGLAAQGLSSGGNPRWYATSAGRDIAIKS